MSEYYNLYFDVDNQGFQDNFHQQDADDEEINNSIQFNVYPQLFNYSSSVQGDDVDIQENREKIVADKITIEDEQKICEIPQDQEFESNSLRNDDIVFEEEDNRTEQDSVQSEDKNFDNKTTQEILNAPIIKQVNQKQEQLLNVCKMKKDVKIDKSKACEQVETKNLPNYYCRTLLKYVKSSVATSKANQQVKLQQNKKLLKFDKKMKCCTLKTLRDMLSDEEMRDWAIEYFTSFQFLDDLLKSEKQQDVRPPIKYLNKMYLGCLDRNTLNYWKET